ncbi:anti-sigma factor [Roseomonas nepalensis]|uniref:Anti-sigma factor n=1 Tax=Muricoccus nepalensis TaxID=1854500 RepID=A0A502G1Q7_9PROT|nr:anti-sigma factor [Roseomonas nepalensis]TPG55705.1 anti-sigma factor [Roseomonas nepalensis]
MTSDLCHEMSLLVQADMDGELHAAEAARVAAHLETCAACQEFQHQLLALSGVLRRDLPRHRAPDHLRKEVRTRITNRTPGPSASLRRWALGIGPALAAGIVLFALMPLGEGRLGMSDWVVAAHVRALQPQHLLDVASTEQHTVKPWFAGRLPFSPPVRDLASQGFPLVGGRVDALPGSPAAALVYKRREHVINLFAWPTLPEEQGKQPVSGSREGYNFVGWAEDGMTIWAVSDLNERELAEFAARWVASATPTM